MIGQEQSLHDILEVVCADNNVSIDEVKSKSRERYIVDTRHLFCYIARLHRSNFPYRAIAETINRSHCNCINSIKVVKGFIDTNYDFSNRVDQLINSFNGNVLSEKSNKVVTVAKQETMAGTIIELRSDIKSLEQKLADAMAIIKDQLLEIEAYRKQNEVLNKRVV